MIKLLGIGYRNKRINYVNSLKVNWNLEMFCQRENSRCKMSSSVFQLRRTDVLNDQRQYLQWKTFKNSLNFYVLTCLFACMFTLDTKKKSSRVKCKNVFKTLKPCISQISNYNKWVSCINGLLTPIYVVCKCCYNLKFHPSSPAII